jgi:hypothetical protein
MRFRPSLAVVIITAVFAFAACGGGSSTSKTPSTADATATPSSAGATPGRTPAAEATSGAASITGDGADDLKAIVKKFDAATFKVAYTISGGAEEPFADGELVLQKDGMKRIRIDLTGTRDGEKMTIIFIESEDTSVFCLENAAELALLLGVDPSDGICVKSDPNDESNPIGSLSQSLTNFAGENVTVVETSKRSIAGQNAACYKTQNSDTDEVSTTCFNGDGAILYAQTEGDSGSAIEAKSVSKSVKSGDFTPPYEVKELPTGPLGGGGPEGGRPWRELAGGSATVVPASVEPVSPVPGRFRRPKGSAGHPRCPEPRASV